MKWSRIQLLTDRDHGAEAISRMLQTCGLRVLRGLIYFPAVFKLSVFKISLRQPHHKVGRVLDDA